MAFLGVSEITSPNNYNVDGFLSECSDSQCSDNSCSPQVFIGSTTVKVQGRPGSPCSLFNSFCQDTCRPVLNNPFAAVCCTGNCSAFDSLCNTSVTPPVCVPPPTSTPTATSSRTATRTPTVSPSRTSTLTATHTPSVTATRTLTRTPTYTASRTPSFSATPTRTASVTPTPTDRSFFIGDPNGGVPGGETRVTVSFGGVVPGAAVAVDVCPGFNLTFSHFRGNDGFDSPGTDFSCARVCVPGPRAATFSLNVSLGVSSFALPNNYDVDAYVADCSDSQCGGNSCSQATYIGSTTVRVQGLLGQTCSLFGEDFCQDTCRPLRSDPFTGKCCSGFECSDPNSVCDTSGSPHCVVPLTPTPSLTPTTGPSLTPTRSATPTLTRTATRTGTPSPTGTKTATPTPTLISEFPLVSPGAGATDIVEDANHNFWFTQATAAKGLARLIPSTKTVTEFPLPTLNAGPTAITNDSNDNRWFLEPPVNRIARADQGGNVQDFLVPFANGGLTDIILTSEGTMWFTERIADRIGSITLAGTVSTVTTLEPGSQPMGLARELDADVLWFTESGRNKIGRARTKPPMRGVVTEYNIPTMNVGATAIDYGGGFLWFTEVSVNKIGRLTPSTGAIEELGPTSSAPKQIVRGLDGAMWFTLPDGNRMGRIMTIAPYTITEYDIPTANSRPLGITSTLDRSIWFTEFNGDRIGRLIPR
jgi:streptogramin lyase